MDCPLHRKRIGVTSMFVIQVRSTATSPPMSPSKWVARWHPLMAVLLLAPFLVGCRKTTQTIQTPASGGGDLRPYSGSLEPDDGQWVRATKDYANTRYSTLAQINT